MTAKKLPPLLTSKQYERGSFKHFETQLSQHFKEKGKLRFSSNGENEYNLNTSQRWASFEKVSGSLLILAKTILNNRI